jgi:photosystem II stability/assembly factor-like uncharacterized protein
VRGTPFVLLLAIGAGTHLFFSAADASANGRLPAAGQLLFGRNDANLVVLRTTFGILLSHDAGNTWAWLCEDALGVSSSSTEDPTLALTANGNLVAGFSKGLSVSSDSGCDWTFAGSQLATQYVVDLAVRPDSPDAVLALTSTYGGGVADGSPGYAQQIFESTSDGADWSARGAPIDPTALVTALDVSGTDPNRIYVSAYRAGTVPTAALFVSSDGGSTWIERPVSLDPNGREISLYVAAVDPANADRVYVRTSAQTTTLSRPAQPSRLLVSDDAGVTFRTALSLTGQMLGFALSPDGSTVSAGSIEDGLFVAQAANLSFQRASAIHVECLATHGLDLWACSDEASGFLVGVSTDGGTNFLPKAQLRAQPTVLCAADATATVQCTGAPRQALCSTVPGCDADGSNVAGSGGGALTQTRSSRGCGCSLGHDDDGAASLAAVGALVGVAAARPRRRLAAQCQRSGEARAAPH